MTKYVRGDKLSYELQREVLSKYVHRYTREHVPSWARKEWKDGKPYPVQFDSDRDWLANTFFSVTTSGRLSRREKHCRSNPTWPDNPELRAKYSVA